VSDRVTAWHMPPCQIDTGAGLAAGILAISLCGTPLALAVAMLDVRTIFFLWAITVMQAGILGLALGARYAPHGSPLPARAAAVTVACAPATIESTVTREVAERWIAEERGARIVPALVDGRPSGFKLYGIRAGSPLARLGLENGDTVRAIQGRSIETAGDAFELVGELEHAARIELDLERRGRRVTLAINLV
jgi:hypothetical protein